MARPHIECRSLACSLCRHHSRSCQDRDNSCHQSFFLPTQDQTEKADMLSQQSHFCFLLIFILFFPFIFILYSFQQLNLPTIICRISNNTHGFSLFSHEKHLIFISPWLSPSLQFLKSFFFA